MIFHWGATILYCATLSEQGKWLSVILRQSLGIVPYCTLLLSRNLHDNSQTVSSFKYFILCMCTRHRKWRPFSAHFTVIFNRHVFLPAPRMYHIYPNTHWFKSISLYVYVHLVAVSTFKLSKKDVTLSKDSIFQSSEKSRRHELHLAPRGRGCWWWPPVVVSSFLACER